MNPDRQLQRFTPSDLSSADCVERSGRTTSGHSYAGISASGNARVYNGDSYTFNLHATDAGPATKRLKSEHDSFESRQQSETLRNEFLDRVRFPEIFTRQESLKSNTSGTYEWVFTGESPFADTRSERATAKDRELRGRIQAWLQNTESLFWIKGKPGSGKSSLMSSVLQDQRTKTKLQTWAGDCTIYVVSFFFWKVGSDLQKTIPGLLRSILWQLGKFKSTAIDEMMTRDPSLSFTAWNEARLLVALERMLEAYHSDRILLLIDGLDECEDDHGDLIKMLRRLGSGSHVKTCVSSRPETALTVRLGTLPGVSLQDLNFNDILIHAKTVLEPCGKGLEDFSTAVAREAEGVFLWAVLVCKSLVRGYVARDDETILRQRLATFPRGLEGLFARMFSEIDEVHFEPLKLYLHSVDNQKYSTSVALIAATLHRQRVSNLEHFAGICSDEQIRIVSQSRGLIELTDMDYRSGKDLVRNWALKHVPTRGIRQDPVDLSESHTLQKYLDLRLRWVHRSAYEYIQGASRTDNTFRMHPLDRDRRNRRLWQGALWLAQFLPIVGVECEYCSGFDDLLTVFDSQPSALTLPFFAACERNQDLDQEIENGLNTLHDAICSWMHAMQQEKKRDQLLVSKYLDPEFETLETPLSKPMYRFWVMVFVDYPEYLTRNSNRLLRDSNTERILSGVIARLLLVWADYFPNEEAEKIDRQRLLALSLITNDFRLKHHYCHTVQFSPRIRSASIGYMSYPKFCTWFCSAFRNYDEESFLEHAVYALDQFWKQEFARRSFTTASSRNDIDHLFGQYTTRDIFARVFDLLDAWPIFVGMLTPPYFDNVPPPYFERKPKRRQTIDIQLPIRYAYSSLLPESRRKNVNPLAFVAARPVVRLWNMQRALSTKEVLPPEECALQTFDLSQTVSVRLIKLLSQQTEQHGRVVLMFTGSSTDFHSLTNVILAEIWADANNQLTAWGRLYCRACVRRDFKVYWLNREGA